MVDKLTSQLKEALEENAELKGEDPRSRGRSKSSKRKKSAKKLRNANGSLLQSQEFLELFHEKECLEMRIESKENDYDTMKQTIEDLQC